MYNYVLWQICSEKKKPLIKQDLMLTHSEYQPTLMVNCIYLLDEKVPFRGFDSGKMNKY